MPTSTVSFTHRAIGLAAGTFGLATITSGGSVALRVGSAYDLAGDVVPFVVWFNFVAGFFYVIAALGIWDNRGWARPLAVLITASTVLVAAGFVLSVASGHAFELRTVVALSLRFVVWAGISTWLTRKVQT